MSPFCSCAIEHGENAPTTKARRAIPPNRHEVGRVHERLTGFTMRRTQPMYPSALGYLTGGGSEGSLPTIPIQAMSNDVYVAGVGPDTSPSRPLLGHAEGERRSRGPPILSAVAASVPILQTRANIFACSRATMRACNHRVAASD